MIKAIIFDFDGVIHDTFESSYLNNKKIIPSLTHAQYRDFYNGNVFNNRNVTDDEIKLFFSYQVETFKTFRIDITIKEELLKLKEKYDLFIISSNKEVIMNDYFKRNDMVGVFKDVLGLETEKSKIKKFELLFVKYDLNKDNCFFVTDTLGDILEANKVGLKTIAVDFGFHEAKRLAKGNPLVIVSDFGGIFTFIEK